MMLVLFCLAAFGLGVLLTVIGLNFVSGEKKVARHIRHIYSTGTPQFTRTMGILLGPAIAGGNQVTALVNGDAIFPSMLAAIRNASCTICFETYIYWSGGIGRTFAEHFAERARAGIRVHVLVDWVGSARMDQTLFDLMRDAGVQIEKYHPLRWYNLGRINNRTHRKLLVIDGCIGYTGGVGIADQWCGNAEDDAHWRDTHFRIEGPAVAQMQAAFMDNWIKTRGALLHGEDYFPPLAPAGRQNAQIFKSSWSEGSESIRLMYLLSISCAQQSIYLANAYFVPDALSTRMLIDAVQRGVVVRIIVPGRHIDQSWVRHASRACWGKLLRAGVEIYEYQPTMFHCKVMIIDHEWVSVGSTNFDNRSFRLNDEANLNVLDAGFARQQIEIFNADLQASKRVSLNAWAHRPLSEKVFDNSAALLRSQL